MAIKSEPPDRTCFVIAPIGDKESRVRRDTDGLVRAVIRPAMTALGLDVVAPHELPHPGSITNQVIQHLLQDRLVVADLSAPNPNVMYELAVRHAKGLPVVPIVDDTTKLPFDVQDYRAIEFTRDIRGGDDLKEKLTAAAEKALEDEGLDNPIYRAAQASIMRELVAENDSNGYILERLDKIEDALSSDAMPRGLDKSLDEILLVSRRLDRALATEQQTSSVFGEEQVVAWIARELREADADLDQLEQQLRYFNDRSAAALVPGELEDQHRDVRYRRYLLGQALEAMTALLQGESGTELPGSQ